MAKEVKKVKSTPYQICVSGAAKGTTVTHAFKLAEAAGAQIAKRGHILLTGSTTGLPDYAAKACKENGGISIGFSPAASRIQHVKTYRLPIKHYDSIVCTGFDYTGRDLLLVRSSDAVVAIGGRIGTLQEFAVAFEEKTPIGVVIGSGGITDAIAGILKAAKRSRNTVLYDRDPARLVDKLIKILDTRYRKIQNGS